MAKKLKTYESMGLPEPPALPTYACKHWLESVGKEWFIRGDEYIPVYHLAGESGSSKYPVINDERFANTIALGKFPTDYETNGGRGSTMLCDTCGDVYHLAGGAAGSLGWYAWKEDYDKRMAPPVVEETEEPEPA